MANTDQIAAKSEYLEQAMVQLLLHVQKSGSNPPASGCRVQALWSDRIHLFADTFNRWPFLGGDQDTSFGDGNNRGGFQFWAENNGQVMVWPNFEGSTKCPAKEMEFRWSESGGHGKFHGFTLFFQVSCAYGEKPTRKELASSKL